MFDSLKKKLLSWVGKGEEAPASKEKKPATKAAKKPAKETKKEPPKKAAAKKAEPSSKKTGAVKKSSAKKTVAVVQASEEELASLSEHEDEESIEEDIEAEGHAIADETIAGSARPLNESVHSVSLPAAEEPSEEKGGFFARLAKKLTASTLSQEDFDEFFSELEITLLEHNVALEVVDTMRATLAKELIGSQAKKQDVQEKILGALMHSIDAVLLEPPDIFKEIKRAEKPYVILFFGINGSGKTTSIAKFAHRLKKEGFSCVMAAGDTFRAASIEQLQTHGQRIDVPVIAQQYLSDPAAVAFDAVAYAKKHHIDVVLVDTAGRMYTQSNLMREMEKIVRVAKPNLKLFVGESITGNDATEQARMFHQTAGIDGIILSKADVDEKAGTILSVSAVTGKPIYFLGVGQEYGDLEVFTKKRVLEHLGLA